MSHRSAGADRDHGLHVRAPGTGGRDGGFIRVHVTGENERLCCVGRRDGFDQGLFELLTVGRVIGAVVHEEGDATSRRQSVEDLRQPGSRAGFDDDGVEANGRFAKLGGDIGAEGHGFSL